MVRLDIRWHLTSFLTPSSKFLNHPTLTADLTKNSVQGIWKLDKIFTICSLYDEKTYFASSNSLPKRLNTNHHLRIILHHAPTTVRNLPHSFRFRLAGEYEQLIAKTVKNAFQIFIYDLWELSLVSKTTVHVIIQQSNRLWTRNNKNCRFE